MTALTAQPRYWPVLFARAVPALVVGLVITFSADHSSTFGLIVFGAFAIVTGIIIGWDAAQSPKRALPLVQASITVVSGVSALVFFSSGAGTLFLIVITFAASTGFLELYRGLRARRNDPIAREWISVGVLTSMLAIAVLLVPADYAAPWSVIDKGLTVSGTLTSQIIVVGIVGAYAILLGVYLVIAGLSARWATRDDNVTTTAVTGK